MAELVCRFVDEPPEQILERATACDKPKTGLVSHFHKNLTAQLVNLYCEFGTSAPGEITSYLLHWLRPPLREIKPISWQAKFLRAQTLAKKRAEARWAKFVRDEDEEARNREKWKTGERQQWIEENERFAADPAVLIRQLASQYEGTIHRWPESRDKLWRRADDFIYGHYLRALKNCDKSNDRKGAAKLVADVQRAILRQVPESAFRRYLQKQVKALAGIGLRGAAIPIAKS